MFKRHAYALLAVLTAVALVPAVADGSIGLAAMSSTLTPRGFGFASFEASTGDTQAGSHPPSVTVTFELDKEVIDKGLLTETYTPVGGEARNVEVNLPPGMIGNANAVPQCTRSQFTAEECPGDTRIGTNSVDLGGAGATLLELPDIPLYNLVPPPGIPAQFGFELEGIHTFLDAGLRTGGDNGVTMHIDNTPQRGVIFVRATVLGSVDGNALLTLPTSCGAPLKFDGKANTWEEPNEFATAPSFEAPPMTGCERLSFHPSIALAPDTSVADSPAGLSADVRVPPEAGLTNPTGLAASNLKEVKVTLPAGLAINPGRASGLAACQPSQDGLEPMPDGEEDNGPPSCPAASRIGSVEVQTPLLRDALKGNVYVLQSNPPNIQVLLALSGDGVNLKLVGDVHLDEETGQLTTTFSKAPDVPFTDLKLSLEGGSRGALVTPAACGTYSTSTDFTPWATPYVLDAFSENTFSVQSGPEGASCGGGQPFAPTMVAGMTSNQAGGFGSFSVTLSRPDRDQQLGGVAVQTPPGLLGLLKTVEQCGEPQASVGECGPGSLIGHTTVALGSGPDPLWVQGGQVFLTGPYKGALFGLSIMVPAVAGPFTLLGNAGPGKEVVRAAIEIDPHTAQITVVSDQLPGILDGVPLQFKAVNVTIDRQGFMFNPTNCSQLHVSGTISGDMPDGSAGASVAVSSPFAAAGCAGLPFKPSFKISTQAKTSKAKGASLDVKYTSGAGQANTAKVAVSLPKALPARLTTIQQSCTEAAFDANPASCPAASVIGTATASTPILANAVSGPVYLVSHGGAAFPNVVAILQGENVTIDLVGSIDIKHGVTSAAFDSVPDAPISVFQMVLPEGPHSGLAANLPGKAKGSMCGQNLTMPTVITGQNGAVIKQTTKIAVTGCPKAKKKTKAKKHKSKAHKKSAKTKKG